MDTNRIKRFATEARNILKAGIAAKITTLGFDKNGNVAEENKPQLMQGGSLWNEQLQTEGFYHQWMSLYNRIQQIGIIDVYEEAAYTWFNRLCAIRILQKNNLCGPVLAYADAARTPIIVDEARQGRIPQMEEDMRQRLVELLDDDTKVTEQFAILITAWCHDNPIINKCFGSIADYTELLLPNNILAEGGFVDLLNHTEFITDEDFHSPELIGWLYQFYISERKDEVFDFFKKGKKAESTEDIAAATQIFTPNWIVKYMVQNTVGRIFLDNNPYETQLQKKWKYLVPIYNLKSTIYNSESQEPSAQPIINSKLYTINYSELEDLKVGDLACGSGHILNECFDLLYDLYIAEGYGRGEAVENIFSHNLTGIDLDTRAKQLSQFALLLKACQKDAAFADAHCMPNVLDMPKPWNRETQGPIQDMLHIYFQGKATDQQKGEIMNCFDLMHNADTLGSIMKFDICENTRLLIKQTTDYWCSQEIVPEEVRAQMPAFKLILALTEKYHALIANPPYMGRGHMTSVLSKYLDKNYPNAKSDLFSTFMDMMLERTVDNGKTAFITMESWMFLSSFEKFRKNIIDNYHIASLGHFGWHIIGIAFGTAMTVIDKCKSNGRKGVYSYLTIDDIDREKNVPFVYPKKDNGRFAIIEQKNFEKIPGCLIGYWLGHNWSALFNSNKSLGDKFAFKKGMSTGNNTHFIRNWSEVSLDNITFTCSSNEESLNLKQKWYPINYGGIYRKWYGNQDSVANWMHDGEEMKANAVLLNKGGHWSRYITSTDRFFKAGLSWNAISSGNICVRYFGEGFLFCSASMCGYGESIIPVIGLLNSKVSMDILKVLAPTMNYGPLQIKGIPYIERIEICKPIIEENIQISKQDWDAHETSWDFQRNELLSIDADTYMENINYEIEKHFEETGEHISLSPAAPQLGSLEWRMEQYKTKWERKFISCIRTRKSSTASSSTSMACKTS